MAQKARKIPGAERAKEKFYKAPKLIYTVILWYSFVVQSPLPQGGEPSLHDCPPPRGGTGLTKGGGLQRGGGYAPSCMHHCHPHKEQPPSRAHHRIAASVHKPPRRTICRGPQGMTLPPRFVPTRSQSFCREIGVWAARVCVVPCVSFFCGQKGGICPRSVCPSCSGCARALRSIAKAADGQGKT